MKKEMMLGFSILSLFAGLICFGTSSAYAQNEGCLAEVKGIYTQMEAKMNQLNGKNFYMNITQTNKLTQQLGGEEHSSTMELSYNGQLSHLKSNEIEVIQDAEKTISIIPNRQLVMINKSSLEEFKQSILLQTSALYDEIFAHVTVASCTKFKKNGSSYKRITLDLNEEKQKELFVKQFIYTINVQQNVIDEVKVFYAASAGQLEYMIVKFNQLSFNKTDVKLSSKPMAEVYSNSGQLKTRFSSYKIVDNTK